MKTCLVVIDAQESFRHHPAFCADELPAYLATQNALIAGALAAGLPVLRVLHENLPAEPHSPFSVASGHVRPLSGLTDFEAAADFVKHRHSALVGSGLEVWLTQHGVRRLIVSGIRTEQCCETTTRHASDLGWEVDFALDATLTFAMTQPDGSPLSAAQIKARTATVLQGRFAHVCSGTEALVRAAQRQQETVAA